MKRTSVNPWEWGLQFGMDQAQLVEGMARVLHCSGQVSVKPDPSAEMGIGIVAPGDMRGQITQALANIDAVLEKAGLTRTNVLCLRVFTTDVDAYLANYDVYAAWVGEAGIRPPQTLLGISRLFVPDLLVEIEATAGA